MKRYMCSNVIRDILINARLQLKGNLLFLLVVLGFASCDKGMFDVSGEFYHRPEDLYLGAVDSIKVWPGYKRVKLSWEIKSDPRIKKTMIYWDKRDASSMAEIRVQEDGKRLYTYEIQNLTEKDYTFELQIHNDRGLFSLPKQISTAVLGDSYVNNLKNRSIAKITRSANGEVQVDWNPIASADIMYTIIRYESTLGPQTYQVMNTEAKSTLVGTQIGQSLKVSTCFHPKGTLDPLFVPEQTIILP